MNSASLDVAALETLVSAAVAAPSIHNARSWRLRLDPDSVTLEIRTATDHAPHHVDPAGRALHLAAGCAVLNLRVAVAHFGWEPVTRLLPRPDEPDLLATVQIAGGSGNASVLGLYDALWRRHSSRFPFSGRPLPGAVLGELADAARAEGALLSRPTRQQTERLLELTGEAEGRTMAGRAAEIRPWARGPHPAALDRPAEPLGPQGCRDRIPRGFPAHRHPAAGAVRRFEKRPLLAVVTTEHDQRIDWLRAGQALERVLLVATAHGVRTSLLHQALEWPDLRARLRPWSSGLGHAQMVVRLGYGPEAPASARHAAQEVLAPQRATLSPSRRRSRSPRLGFSPTLGFA
ncbi:Acg family FMN-binding oxidoreductase [Streptomyces sp. NPDC001020]